MQPAPRQVDTDTRPRPAADRVAAVGIVAGGLAVLCASLLWHTRLVQSGEYDQYLQIAEALQRGHVPNDRFHPLLYPLLVAGVGYLTPTVFAAGKLVSAAALAVLLFAVHRLLRRGCTAPVALAGTAVIALGPLAWLEGMLVATDMSGTALVVLAYALVLVPDPGGRRALLAGLAVGAATAMRFNLGVHVPVVLLILLAAKSRLLRPLQAGAGVALGILPHVVARLSTFDTVVGNQNWKNIVLKYEFARDMSAMRAQDDATLSDLLAEHWHEWLLAGLGDFGEWLLTGLPRLLLDRAAGQPVLAWGVLALLVAGAALALARRRRLASWLLIAALAHALLVTVTFVPEPRLLMVSVILVTITALLGYADAGKAGPWLAALLLSMAGLMHGMAIPEAWRTFRGLHADSDVAAAQALVDEHGPLIQIAGTYPFLGREVECAGTAMLLGGGNVPRGDAEEWFWAQLERTASQDNASWFVLGSVTGRVIHRTMRTAELLPGWTRVRADDDVVVLHRKPDLAIRLAVEPVTWSGGPARLRVTIGGAEDGDLVWVGVELRGPRGATRRVELPRRGDGWELELPWGELPPGTWTVVATVLRRSGRIERGDAAQLTVE